MSAPDLDGMTKDQIVAWLMDPANDGLKEVIRTAQRVDDGPTTSGDVPPQIPLMLTSIRLPIELVRALDDIAAVEGMSRSDVMRLAVASFVDGRQGAVSPSDALYALDVLRRVVTEHEHAHRNAA